LFLSPHPDDETLFAGGYLSVAQSLGATVHVTLVTDGNRRGHHAERMNEFREATRTLGLSEEQLSFYQIPDGNLTEKEISKLSGQLAHQIIAFKPTLVIAPHTADKHTDHRIIGQAALDQYEHGGFSLAQYLAHFPPSFPWPRKHLPHTHLLPPRKLRHEDWLQYPLTEEVQRTRHKALQAYQRELKTPTLRSLLLAFDRRNELFVALPAKNR
jgi:LmbE family N-acetylglucosaminyl deacetylase